MNSWECKLLKASANLIKNKKVVCEMGNKINCNLHTVRWRICDLLIKNANFLIFIFKANSHF